MKWKPEIGEGYFIPDIHRGYPPWEDFAWNDSIRHMARYESGIVCRNAGEALKLAEKMLAVAREYMEAKGG